MRHTTDKYTNHCGCRSVGECNHNLFSWARALDACADDFNDEMKRKLKKKFMEGKSGWDSENWDIEDIKRQLIEHVEKGDFVDVANFAMFAWNKSA